MQAVKGAVKGLIMEKHGKKVGEKAKAEIIRLSKDYSPKYIAQRLELHPNTVRRVLERDREERVMASHYFQKHCNEVSELLKYLVSSKELLDSSLVHFKQEFPGFAHLNAWQDISDGDIAKGIYGKIELLAESRVFHFYSKCLVCQAIKKRLVGKA